MMWHPLGNKRKLDLELFSNLLHQFLLELSGQLVFHNLGQLFAPPDKGPRLITGNSFGLAPTRNKAVYGIEPGRNVERGARLYVDSTRCQTREKKAPNFLASLDYKWTKEVHSCLLENVLPSLQAERV
jgi:hypothetical protein